MIAMRRCYAISIIGMEGKNMNHNKKKILKVTALFVFMFFLGWGAGSLQKQQMIKTRSSAMCFLHWTILTLV